MPGFKNKEDYEKWKAEKLKGTKENQKEVSQDSVETATARRGNKLKWLLLKRF